MIITGIRHPEGGVKILISLYGFTIESTELYFRIYVYCCRAAIRNDGQLNEIHETEGDKSSTVSLVDSK